MRMRRCTLKTHTATYSPFLNEVRVLKRDTNNGKYQVKWYLDNTFIGEDSTQGGKGRNYTDSPYGNWNIHNWLNSAVSNSENRNNAENLRHQGETRFYTR